MRPSVLRPFIIVVVLLVLAGCSIFTTTPDETAGWSAQHLYGAAQAAMASKSWGKAVKYFEKLEARYPYGRYAEAAQLDLGYAYWKDDERAFAIAAVDRFIKLHPDNPHVDYAYYLKGLINFNEHTGLFASLDNAGRADRDQKASRKAFEAFKQVVTRFPNSKYAADSAARMRYLVDMLAQYEVDVARYYMKRGAYVAAVNRAQYAIKEYPRTPATQEALYIMMIAYRKLGLPNLSGGAAQVLHKNFPHSKYYKVGLKQSAPWWKVWDSNW